MSGYSIAQFVFAPLWGQLSDRVGRRPVLVASIGLTAVFLALFASAQALWMLFLFRILHGAATANISTAQACMADLSTKADRAKAMGMIGAAFGLGFTIGPVIGGGFSPDGFGTVWLAQVAQSHPGGVLEALNQWVVSCGITTPLWIAVGLSVFNFFQALILLPETRRPDSAPASHRVSLLATLDTLRHPALGLCIALVFVQVFSFSMVEATFTLFAEHAHGLTAAKVGELFGIIGIVGIIVQGGMIRPLLARLGERPLIIAGLAILAFALVLLPFASLGAPLYIVFSLMAVGQGIINPSLSGLISRTADDNEQGKVLGSMQSMSALARAFGPFVGGVVFQDLAPGAPFWLAAVLVGFGTVLAFPATERARARL
jgi:MFS family permease